MGNPTIDEVGTKTWHNKDGQIHRLYAPAVIRPNGIEMWYQNGLRHRLDGPAVTIKDRKGGWWYVNNKELDGETMEELTARFVPTIAIVCYLAHPGINIDNINQKIGHQTGTKPTPFQLKTWYMLAGLTP